MDNHGFHCWNGGFHIDSKCLIIYIHTVVPSYSWTADMH